MKLPSALLLTMLAAGVADCTIAAFSILAQAPSTPGVVDIDRGIVQGLGSITAMGVLAWLVYTVTRTTIPGMLTAFREECKDQRAMFAERAESQQRTFSEAMNNNAISTSRLVDKILGEHKPER